MKNVTTKKILLLTIFTALCTIVTAQNTLLANDNNNNEISASTIVVFPEPTRRIKKQTVSVFLQGLAQSCAHLGTVVGAQNEQQKQQGILNVVGSVLSTAAALAGPSQQAEQIVLVQEQPTQEVITKKVIALSHAFFDSLDTECHKTLHQLPPLLAAVKSFPGQEEREAVIEEMLSSTHDAKEYVSELLEGIYSYLAEKASIVINFVKERITTEIDNNQQEE